VVLLCGLALAVRVSTVAAHTPCGHTCVLPAGVDAALVAGGTASDGTSPADGDQLCPICHAASESLVCATADAVESRFAFLSHEAGAPDLPDVSALERDLDSSAPRAPPLG
jgi:hypothetical protein